MRFVVLLPELIFIATSVVAQTSQRLDSSRLLQNAVEHQWTDENHASRFTYTELWHNRNFGEGGELLVDETAKFESIALDGKPYLRMIEQDGKPLHGDDANAENSSYNSAIATGKGMDMQERISAIASRNIGLHLHLDLLPKYFHSRIVGTETVNGRPAFHLDCTPRTDVKPKGKEAVKGMQFHVQVWIDKEAQAFVRVDAELLKDRDEMRSGTTARLTWTLVDEIWLPARVDIQGQGKLGKDFVRFDTDYIYSDYKRFASDIRILSEH
jgi:hypothetical protein